MKKIKITREFEINAKKDKGSIIFYDAQTVNIVMGTSAATANLHIYGIKKNRNEWVVPKESIIKRIEKLERDISKAQTKLNIMRQITL